MRPKALAAVAFLMLVGASASASAARITCESRNFQRNYCSTGERIASARVVVQQSRSPCVQGRTWGYDSGGIWVTQGCAAEFDFRPSGGGSGRGHQIACSSQNFQHRFCRSDRRVVRARLIEQRSRAACVQGRTWGFQDDGIWVDKGCSGLFAVEERGRPTPPSVNRVSCESRGFQYAFCGVGRAISRAWLDEQRSRAPCIQGESWGFQGGGVWVDKGCSAVFAFDAR